ncbi:MAG: hypothetical protein O3A88_02135 [Proteobacteria bacterium]|nr:hypothetical protein [Pseudomonadota bacterium]
MVDKILGALALLVFIGFLGVLVWRAPLPDLAIVLGVVFAMAAYVFWFSFFRKKVLTLDPVGAACLNGLGVGAGFG